jgi:beta-phosphoglucomutase-like phosphatase (HAD superfamily)
MATLQGVCVFDYDGTVTGDKAAAARALIATCGAHGFALALNTARFRVSTKMKAYLASLGLHVDALPPEAVQVKAFTSKKKARAMEAIRHAYNVQPHQVVLYDNRGSNVRRVKQHGFRAVNVNAEGMVHPVFALATAS